MRIHFKIITLAGIWIVVISACSVKWTEAIHDGSIAQNEFKESVEIEINIKLIIVPSANTPLFYKAVWLHIEINNRL